MALLLSVSVGVAQPAEPKLPEGLRQVTLDAIGFVHFRAGDFLRSPVGKILLHELPQDHEAANSLKKIEQTLGIEAADLESVTVHRQADLLEVVGALSAVAAITKREDDFLAEVFGDGRADLHLELGLHRGAFLFDAGVGERASIWQMRAAQ